MYALCEIQHFKSFVLLRISPLAETFAICEVVLMAEAPSYVDLADKAGISRSYAHQILSTTRKPSLPLAIRIYRKTGWRPSNIADLSGDQIALLEQMSEAA